MYVGMGVRVEVAVGSIVLVGSGVLVGIGVSVGSGMLIDLDIAVGVLVDGDRASIKPATAALPTNRMQQVETMMPIAAMIA